jgi:ketosteroid isomerase-like protein
MRLKNNSRKGNLMKLITSLLGSLALTFVVSAVAQEESPAPSPEAKAPAAAQETAAPAAAAPEAKATESPTTAPPEQKKEAPSKPAAAKSPSAAAAAPSGKRMTVEAALKDNENRWEAASAKHDTATIGSMVADDFIGVYLDGKITSRSGVIGEAKKDRDTYTSAVNEKLTVRSYGPNVAVVVGTAHEKGTGKDAKPFDRKLRFTDTWVERNGRWQCVASQVMKVQ